MHVGLHQLSDDVDVLKPCLCWGFRDIQYLDDVLVVEELEELDFSDNTLCVD